MRTLTVTVVDSNDIQKLENRVNEIKKNIDFHRNILFDLFMDGLEESDSYVRESNEIVAWERELATVKKQLAILKKAGEEYDYLVALEARFY